MAERPIHRTWERTGHGTRFVFSDGTTNFDFYELNKVEATRKLKEKIGDINKFRQFKLKEINYLIKIPDDRKQKRPHKPARPPKCVGCGGLFRGKQMIEGRCLGCHDEHLRFLREDVRRMMELDIERYKNKMEECTTGVCDMLAVHHERLKDDDQRLRTDFMIGIICGEEKRQKYLTKKEWDRTETSPALLG